MPKSLLTAALTALVLAVPAVAQVNPALNSTTVKPNIGATIKTTPLKAKMLPPRLFKPAQGKANMDGWIALTDTATLGGASVYSIEGHSDIVTTGGDGGLYIARFDPNAPALIKGWNFQPGGLISEPHCKPYKDAYDSAGNYRILCFGVTPAGTAKMIQMRDTSGFGYDYAMDLGGKLGTEAPNLLDDPYDGPTGYYSSTVRMGVDIGVSLGGQLWVYRYFEGEKGAWGRADDVFRGAPVWYGGYGFTPAANGTVLRVLPVNPATKGPFTYNADIANSPLAPVALSGETASVAVQTNLVVIVARGEDAQLYQIAFDVKNKVFMGGWKANGGVLPVHTWPSCVAANQKPVCVIQGADGKLYAKTLQAGGAL